MLRFLLSRCESPAASSSRAKRPLSRILTRHAASTTSDARDDTASLPSSAKVVICGGGLVGSAVAYQLAESNMRDIVLLDAGTFTLGSTSVHGGILQQFGSNHVETSLLKHTNSVYDQLSAAGYDIGLHRAGSLSLARTIHRLAELERMATIASAQGFSCRMVKMHELRGVAPPNMRIDDLHGALLVPQDGVVDPTRLTHALLDCARLSGVTAIENCTVQRVRTERYNGIRRVTGVETDNGVIECGNFINCAGMGARQLALRDRVRLPVYPVSHQCLISHAAHNRKLADDFPVIRDWDGRLCVRNINGDFLIGGFENDARPWRPSDPMNPACRPPVGQLEPDFDQFQPILEQFLTRFPDEQLGRFGQLLNALEGVTPDGRWIIGEAPEVLGYFIAGGMNGRAAEVAGGIGKYVADLIVKGRPNRDIWNFEPSRFLDMHNNINYLRERSSEVVAETVAINYPFKMECAPVRCRRVRTSPLYAAFREHGAVFGQFNGYERPLWFENDEIDTDLISTADSIQRTVGRPHWFPFVEYEYSGCRQRVALIDMSSFSKFIIWSPSADEVVAYLQYLCSNDIDIPVGRIIHSGLQNHFGGYENDASIARLDAETFFVVAPTVQQTRALYWLLRNRPVNSSVAVEPVTSLYTAINVIGPLSRELMSHFAPVSAAEFPFFSFRKIDIGYASGILAMNLTHTGEVGWLLYVPNEYALHVYETLLDVGRQYNICHAGHLTMRTLRIERLYGYWGQDLDSTTTPIECGRMFRVRFDKGGDFIGRDALLDEMSQRGAGPKRLYVQLLLDDFDLDSDPWPMGGEPIYCNGIYCGKTTTAGYGFTLERQVCLGYVKNPDPETGESRACTGSFIQSSRFEVIIGGRRFPAKVNIRSPRLPAPSLLAGSSVSAAPTFSAGGVTFGGDPHRTAALAADSGSNAELYAATQVISPANAFQEFMKHTKR